MKKNIGVLSIIGIIITIMVIILVINYNTDRLQKDKENMPTRTVKEIPIEKNVKHVVLTNNTWTQYQLEKSAGNVNIDGVNIDYIKMRWKTELNDTWTEGPSISGINNITILEFRLKGIKKVKVKLFQKN